MKKKIDHTIFKTPLKDHDKGKASNSRNNNNDNYTYIAHNYNIVVNYLRAFYDHITTITINNNKILECIITTHKAKVTLQGAPSNPQPKS
jgi:CRISPR/Cas system CSM-associated protein Csm2 small subunit